MLRTVRATRYVTPLREGGSLPAIVEADDLGLYVLKFHGAGQGPKALVAEVIAGQLGRALGLKVPELVLVEVDAALGRNEPDEEIRDLLRASVGLNLGIDYLPGSVMFDPAANERVDSRSASDAVWFDSFVTNVDRTARNPNLLWWHREMYFIDHGASLYFHHNWKSAEQNANTPFPKVRDHLLLPWACELAMRGAALRMLLNEDVITAAVQQVPDDWLSLEPEAGSISDLRTAYIRFLLRRLDAATLFVEEAIRARAELV